MTVCTAADPTLLASLLEEQAAATPGTDQPVRADDLV